MRYIHDLCGGEIVPLICDSDGNSVPTNLSISNNNVYMVFCKKCKEHWHRPEDISDPILINEEEIKKQGYVKGDVYEN